MRMARSVSMAALVVGVCGFAASAQQVQVLAGVGAGVRAVGPTVGQEGYLTTIEHASASPSGQVVVVGRRSDMSNQIVWVRSVDGTWTQRVVLGRSSVTQLNNAPLTGNLLGVPVINSNGDLLVVSQVTSGSTTPALVRFAPNSDGNLLLRFNTASGVGVPASGIVSFSGATTDGWRLSNSTSMYSSRSIGLFGSPSSSSIFSQLTAVTSQNGGARAGSGTALPIGSAGDAATSSSGWTAQRISTGAYGREDLAGFVMFNPFGVGTLAVRDGSTPVEGSLTNFVVSSSPTGFATDATTPGGRVGINSSGTIAFVGRYGVPAPSTGSPTGVPLPVTGTMALFTKSQGHGARVVAEVLPTSGGLPGLEGYRFTGFGSPMINSKGQVAFSALVQGPLGARNSIWTTNADGQLALIAMTGATTGAGAPPADLGGTFNSFTEPSINTQGQVVFSTTTSIGTTLMGYDPTYGLRTLARNNQSVSLPGGGTSAIQLANFAEIGGRALVSSGNDDGLPTIVTDTGKAILRANLVGVGPAVLSIDIPTPRGACCVGSTCELRPRFDCDRAGVSFSGDNTSCIAAVASSAQTCCIADFDQNSVVSQNDLFSFINAWIGQDRIADADQNGSVTFSDLTSFIGEYVSGCPGHGDVSTGRR